VGVILRPITHAAKLAAASELTPFGTVEESFDECERLREENKGRLNPVWHDSRMRVEFVWLVTDLSVRTRLMQGERVRG
jgi:hypothetical protein